MLAIIGIIGQVALYVVPLAFVLILWLGGPPAAPKVTIIDAGRLADVALWFWFVATVIVGPICEEVVFRGFMYRGLAQSRMEPIVAVLVTALVFAGLHLDEGSMWHYARGFLYGCLRWRTASTWAPISAHILNNVVAFTFTSLVEVAWLPV